ncbi:LysR family transcriptional regulator [uncultured Nocardioides sp.]|uniref:LysR family transcriptional regulator n=1 Tax=uncultured Nocardioides sp. TaxID=198441 RepID=UPI00263970F4|nr:LysR family transcriptional regulator [uncultured Nocardioides sp.]
MAIDVGVRHLRAVVAVADAGSFTAAAARLGMTQPSLSRSVAEAERRTGVRMFDRSTRRVRLTADGAPIVDVARHAVAEFDRALAHVEGYLAGARGTVVVGALPSLAATLLPAVVASFRPAHPDVDLQVRDGLAGEVTDRLRAGAVDLALLGGGGDLRSLDVVPVADESFACVFGGDHPFVARPPRGLADLAGQPFVHFDETSSIRHHVDRVLGEAGVTTGVVTQARNITSVAGLVAAGVGASLVPGLVLPLTGFAGLRHRWLEDAGRRRVHLVRSPSRPLSPAARALVEVIEGARSRGIDLPEGCRWATH